jgi:hypothetical protein
MSTWSTIAVSDMASAVGSVSKSAFHARTSSDMISFLVVVSSGETERSAVLERNISLEMVRMRYSESTSFSKLWMMGSLPRSGDDTSSVNARGWTFRGC